MTLDIITSKQTSCCIRREREGREGIEVYEEYEDAGKGNRKDVQKLGHNWQSILES